MAISSAQGSCIASLGHYLPSTVLTTEEATAKLGVDAEWVVARCGIQQRRLADKDEYVVDMATAAAREALTKMATYPGRADTPSHVDTVIVATSTAESGMPSVAAQVAGRLGLRHPAAFDVNAACAGFCYALAAADAIIRAGSGRGVLVIGADKSSSWLDWEDRDTAILFGDGAGAAVVVPHDQRAIGPVLWGSIGEQADLIRIDPTERVIRQDGRSVYRWATSLGETIREMCRRSDVAPEDLAAFVPHQANLRIINTLAKHLDDVTTATDVVDVGNTIAATVPIALSRMVEREEVEDGDSVLLFGFGAGLAYAGQIVTLQTAPAATAHEAAMATAERPG
ncbi:beta-ketoacyl-ACP synthase 3 [Haloactinomyces albus]|uniref:3-oxoacyl-[acyl-carrier-protein] synthase-3 n=1 Tax=Haloactinomyces albus TaxID=1352928 RepID=A0AAE3ZIT4_9ACTN|nr:beta-ketoacyl-ACP synthase 3 [Haloactinomyces albus]MDR7303689.1 3-oxoacyl-[acyl-carrier-protein] synthase-3 [Haloactinomyces albus]